MHSAICRRALGKMKNNLGGFISNLINSQIYLQQRGISGEIQDRKSSSQDAAGDAIYVCEGVLAALATCKAVP